MVSHPILLVEGLVLSLDVKWYMSLENGEGGLPGMKGGAWYENTVFIVWGLSGLEEADQVSDEEASSGNQQEQQVAAPARAAVEDPPVFYPDWDDSADGQPPYFAN